MDLGKVKHPAKYSDVFLPVFASLKECSSVLDPFGGVGKIAEIKKHGYTGRIVCSEIEPDWANSKLHDVDEWHIGDSCNMTWAADMSFDGICTSTYGNRMADHFNAGNDSKRVTYRHYLGKNLANGNTGKMHWGELYKKTHARVYKECWRVLKRNALMIVNVGNHTYKGAEVDVASWHKQKLLDMGFCLKEEIFIKTPKMGFGANGRLRTEGEYILVFTTNDSVLLLKENECL